MNYVPADQGRRIKSAAIKGRNILKPIQMKYRDHRGSLDSSMETQIEVFTIEELKYHLDKSWKAFDRTVAEIKFSYSCYDDRIGWDTYYVLQRLVGESDFWVAGMSDGILDN
jgi:hypothetical protein